MQNPQTHAENAKSADARGSLVGIVSQADVLRKTDNMHRAGKTVEEISEPGGRHAH